MCQLVCFIMECINMTFNIIVTPQNQLTWDKFLTLCNTKSHPNPLIGVTFQVSFQHMKVKQKAATILICFCDTVYNYR